MANPKEAASILHIVLAAVLAIALVVGGATFADEFQLPLIHGWALAHGAVFIVLPVYFLLSYFALWPIARALRDRTSGAPPSKRKRISLLAVASLLLSIGGFALPFVGALVGITAGHAARRRCKDDSRLAGSGIAVAGLVLGYLGLAYSIYIAAVTWIAFR